MYGRKARWARTQLPKELELTPNYAQASLRKTARPVRRSWAGYKIGVLLAELYGTGRTGLDMLPADCGKDLSITSAHRTTAPTSCAAACPQDQQPDRTTVCKELSRQAPRRCDVWSLCNAAGSGRRSAQTRPSDFFRPTDATPNMGCLPSPRATLSCPGPSIVGRTRSRPSMLQGQVNIDLS
jgi:hypothetical protein